MFIYNKYLGCCSNVTRILSPYMKQTFIPSIESNITRILSNLGTPVAQIYTSEL